ncbi:hypothetical protein M758_1G233500 [Ceratodon purpureus]|nr:hypothetical protein M758_1G233500 [Ceratodon purpureus]
MYYLQLRDMDRRHKHFRCTNPELLVYMIISVRVSRSSLCPSSDKIWLRFLGNPRQTPSHRGLNER